MKKTKRILSIMLAAILLFSVLPLTAFAAETDLAESGAIISGTTGTAAYSLDDRGGNQGYKLTVTDATAIQRHTASVKTNAHIGKPI